MLRAAQELNKYLTGDAQEFDTPQTQACINPKSSKLLAPFPIRSEQF
jgi:hypothetical protein